MRVLSVTGKRVEEKAFDRVDIIALAFVFCNLILRL